jgi:hypothetical protein
MSDTKPNPPPAKGRGVKLGRKRFEAVRVNRSSIIPLFLIGAVFALMGVVVGSWATNQTIGIISNVAALLAALAAMLTAVGTFLTVRQMQRQMEASYRPELTFARVFIKGEAHSPQYPLPTRWTEAPRLTENWSGDGVSAGATITLTRVPVVWGFYTNLYNIGLGAATSINIVWNFAVEDMW